MFVSSLGAVPISAEDALIESQNIFKAVFGVDANLDPAGVNGLLIQEIADIIIDNDSALALLYSGLYNPNVAQGVFLDSICAFDQIERREATHSVVTCTCTGLASVVIPAGSQILNLNGDLFQNPDSATVGIGGTVDVEFRSVLTGPISCDSNTVNRIVQTVPGWDSVTNSAGGVEGTTQQSDFSLRVTRVDSLAKNSRGTFNALASALSSNENITDFWFLVNNTDIAQDFETGIIPYEEIVSVNPNSVYLSVYGGSESEIAAIFYDKLSGCGTQGSTTVYYTDPEYSFITNPYHYKIPTTHRLEVDVVLPGEPSDYAADITAQIQQIIYDSFYGIAYTPKVKMYEPITTSRFYAPLATIGLYSITSIEIGLFGFTTYTTFQLNINELGTLAKADVLVSFA